MALVMPNGHVMKSLGKNIDVTDPDYVRDLLRPAVIKEDVKLMQERSRVSLILRSQHFRRELEKIVASQMKEGCLNSNLIALKQIIDYLTPQTKFGCSNFTKTATMPIVPINDLRVNQTVAYPKAERLTRCKLASVYRLVEISGWNRGTGNHITARVARDADEYFISPFGLLYHELTASSLVKIDQKGNILDPGTTGLGIEKQGWMLHSAVYEARPGVRCIIHLNTPATVAASCTKSGLLQISQEAMILGQAAVYDPTAIMRQIAVSTDDSQMRKERFATEERAAVSSALSDCSEDCMVLLVRNHGLLAMGKSVEEAWFIAFNAVLACEAQLRVAGISEDELILPTPEAQAAAHHVGLTPSAVQLRPGEVAGSSGWRRGELEFEAAMRRLDAAGYRTGHVYRIAQIRQSTTAGSTLHRPDLDEGISSVLSATPVTPKEAAAYVRKTASLGRGLRGPKDVEIPPSASSFGTAYYIDEETRAAAAAEAKAKTLSLSRTHWLNTPNSYCRQVDSLDLSTPSPMKISHWTDDSIDTAKRQTGGVALAIDNPNQFAPQGRNPNEFTQQRKRVKALYYKDIKTAGPISRVLGGIDADEDGAVTDSSVTSPWTTSPRNTLQRYDPANPPTLEPGHVVVVGAASKAIIDRDHRHNAGMYQSVFSPNPFERVTDDELKRYRENMDRKAKGLPSLEEEEAAARIEEARHAAEIARQAMEAAAQHPPKQYNAGASLGVDQSHLSPASGADASHDDTEKEGMGDEQSDKKKKKKRFKLPSFARKSKGKSKD